MEEKIKRYILLFNAVPEDITNFESLKKGDESITIVDCNDIKEKIEEKIMNVVNDSSKMTIEEINELAKLILPKFDAGTEVQNVGLIGIDDCNKQENELLDKNEIKELATRQFVRKYFGENLGIEFNEIARKPKQEESKPLD